MIYKSLILRVLLLLVFLPGATLMAQEANIAEGNTLFKNNCASCHNKNMKDDLTGPALGGVEERWADYPQEGALDTSYFTVARRAGEALNITREPVAFTIVKPGESLI